ncbi:MAG: hypothetical protein J5824_05220 [Lachnospiraceae bacterium]|nr:hypothetical protein [Lachnospiraceae bacterium]
MDENMKDQNAKSAETAIRNILIENSTTVGYLTKTCEDDDIAVYARKAATICRRRFKPQEIILLSILDEDEEGEAGVAFTDKAIYCWDEDDNFIFSISYNDIESLDYDSNGVHLTGQGSGSAISSVRSPLFTLFSTAGAETGTSQNSPKKSQYRYTVPCFCYDSGLEESEEQEYIREMYNMLADIVDLIHTNN